MQTPRYAAYCLDVVTFIIVECLSLSNLTASDWPHWRGPTRIGFTTEESGWNGNNWIMPEPKWPLKVGVGASSPLTFRDHLSVLGWEHNIDILCCITLSDGKEVWSRDYPAPKYGRFYLAVHRDLKFFI